MSQKQHQLSNLVVEIAKVPYKNGEILDIRYVKTKNGNIFCVPLDVVKVLHENDNVDTIRGNLSRVILKLGFTSGGVLDSSMIQVYIHSRCIAHVLI
jgi:hypothetical protein